MIAGLRRHRAVVAIVVVVLLGAVTATVVASPDPEQPGFLDPSNTFPDGGRAVARVLAEQGVQVDVVRDADALDEAHLDEDTTVMVTSPEDLGREPAGRLRRRAATAGTLVLAEPTPTLARALGLSLEAGDGLVGPVTADCDDARLGGLTLDLAPTAGYAVPVGGDGTACFTSERSVDPERGVAAVLRFDGPTTTYAVAGADVFANGRITAGDNAAAALRLLGRHGHLVWYVPDRRDIAVGDAGSITAQLPRWLGPALWLVALAGLTLVLWRARRLGPLAVEPLPVVVKAVESTQGRGRLYRRVGDRDHAAGILRRATFRRLSERVRLPVDVDLDTLAAAVARTTGTPADRIRTLLAPGPVPDDATLTTLAHDLALLEQETATR